MLELKGVVSALPAPFRANGALDLEGVRALVELSIEDGVHAVIPYGSMAEPWAIRSDERAAFLEAAVAQAAGRVPVVADLRRRLTTDGGAAADAGIKEIGGVRFAPRLLNDIPAKDLKGMADEMKKQLGSGVVALVAVNDGRASVVVGVTEDLAGDDVDAVRLARVGSAVLGGKGGGGRPDMAQAGGPHGARAGNALEAIEAALGQGA